MAKDDVIELEGTVVESLPNTMFSVDITAVIADIEKVRYNKL